jgi:tRNA A-37 threonylcarbamoyl transferase component Bud32
LLIYLLIYEEEFEDTKGVIKIRKPKKDRQHNGQKKMDKRKWTKEQTTIYKTYT